MFDSGKSRQINKFHPVTVHWAKGLVFFFLNYLSIYFFIYIALILL